MKSVYVITGQTATGKTNFALEIAHKKHGEIINCDSRQIYKKLDIITGKDIFNSKLNFKDQKLNPKFILQNTFNNFDIGFYEFAKTKIWLYDLIDPKSYFSSFDWVQCALTVIKELFEQKKTPIIVGGTYLYLYHLLYQVQTQYIKPNWELRNSLNDKTVKELQHIASSLDSKILEKMNHSDQNNPQRLIRKIELMKAGNISHTYEFITNQKIQLSAKLKEPVQVKYFGFMFEDKNKLLQSIAQRVKNRIKNGAFEEVEYLLKNGYDSSNPGLKTIGYQQILQYLKGKISKEICIQQWVTKEIQFAKRQLTFMKRDENISWKYIN